MPEDLPAESHIKELERLKMKQLKAKNKIMKTVVQ